MTNSSSANDHSSSSSTNQQQCPHSHQHTRLERVESQLAVAVTPTLPSSLPLPPPPPEPIREPPFLVHFAAGTMGGVFGLTLCYPLDTLKVRIQTRPRGTYAGLLDCFRQLVRHEGFGSLYRGLASPVVGYGMIKATAFASYNQGKYWLTNFKKNNNGNRESGKLDLLDLTLCGGFAGFCQTFVRAPVEQIKVVMQSRNKPGSRLAPYSSTMACLKEVLRTEGVARGLYRSFWPTTAREIPQYAIYYPTYELATRSMLRPGQTSSEDLSAAQVAVAGGMAGVAQWVPTYSLDVIKSRVSAAPPGTYQGIIHCARVSIQSEGVGVLWRGISAAVARAFPLHGAVFLGYELSMKMLRPTA